MPLSQIAGSLIASALQAIFGIGATVAQNQYNTPKAQRDRLRKAGLPLAYMYQGKVMGQSEVPKLSIDPTLGAAQQNTYNLEKPVKEQQAKSLKLENEIKDLDNQYFQQFGGMHPADDTHPFPYQQKNRWDLLESQQKEASAAAWLKTNEAEIKDLTLKVEKVLFDENVPQDLRRKELEKIKQQLINMGKQAELMGQLKNIRAWEENISKNLENIEDLPGWIQFMVSLASKIFKPVNLR